jgi:ribA/ribD-fused uncharacterized protein
VIKSKDMRITDDYVFFWGEEFSNFFPCNITFRWGDDVMKFTTSEQMFMWLKAKAFNDDEIANKILLAETPREAKKLGRKVKNFTDEIWVEKRKPAMRLALRHKFSNENPKLMAFILDEKFNGKTFVEASPFDKIWGIGLAENDELADNKANWKGLNLLGECLNEIRDELLNQK